MFGEVLIYQVISQHRFNGRNLSSFTRYMPKRKFLNKF
uniref:Uncharacterized protein n=1 Tax=Setaria viridis TaxID=4556 RepID=A0A4U6SYU9_SETVI|nr:hypothetical protein SEVIR_9G178460v2 [Setaria viridis]